MSLYVLNGQAAYDRHVKTRTNNVANPENTVQGVNAACEDKQTDHFLSVNGNEYECLHHTSNHTGSWILQSVPSGSYIY